MQDLVQRVEWRRAREVQNQKLSSFYRGRKIRNKGEISAAFMLTQKVLVSEGD